MNSVANGKIRENTNFKNIYICPNPGDAGGSVGSASYFIKNEFNLFPIVKNYAFLGNCFSNKDIKKIIDQKKLMQSFKIEYMDDELLFTNIAKLITKEKVIGWFQGKMEWGPRALGNRSILADSRNPKIKEIEDTGKILEVIKLFT